MKKFKKLQIENEKKIQEFIEFFESSLCKRCWAENYKEICRPYHNHGGVLEFIHILPLQKEKTIKWISELSHGFLHGFIVLYIAYCLSKEKDELWSSLFYYNERQANYPRLKMGEKFVMSCLMHDYFKICDCESPHHDSNLVNLTKFFDEVVYTHSNPRDHELEHPLIGADRIELMRYEDHKEWCNQQILDPYIKRYGGQELVDHFYKHIRPVIAKMFSYRNDVWISHILEVDWKTIKNIKDNKNVNFYPKSHWRAEDPAYANNYVHNRDSYFSVNIGRLSDRQCLMHGNPYYGPIGLISLENIRKCGCDLKSAPLSTCGRDHPFVVENQKIPIIDWLFLYTDIKQLDQFDEKDFHVMNKSLFERIYHVTESFITKIIALGVK